MSFYSSDDESEFLTRNRFQTPLAGGFKREIWREMIPAVEGEPGPEPERKTRSVHFDKPPYLSSYVNVLPRPSTRRDHRAPLSVAFKESPVAGQKPGSILEERRVPSFIQTVLRDSQETRLPVATRAETGPSVLHPAERRPLVTGGRTRLSRRYVESLSSDEFSNQEDFDYSDHRQLSISEVASKRVDIVYDPSQAGRDITVRLQMDVEEDVEFDFEELSRLGRLGQFKDATTHFKSKLEHFNSRYLRLLYADMLLASGDYKALQSLPSITEIRPSGRPCQDPENRYGWNLVDTNYDLLGILSQHPEPLDIPDVKLTVHSTLASLSTLPIECSTEAQLLATCFHVLHYLELCAHEPMPQGHEDSPLRLFNWEEIYQKLLSEGCVWDFRDLLVAGVSAFGWEAFSMEFFGTSAVSQVLDTIANDWTGAIYDEASTLGLLDLFTSLILGDLSDEAKSRNSLLLEEAGTLAESAREHEEGLMRSRPFIRWLLAKSALELEDPSERPDGVRLESFKGLMIDQGKGVHLPIYAPSRHTNKPTWDMFSRRSSPATRRAIEVAAAAAHHIGDYGLQAVALKLLILQSQDPRKWIDALSHLQLETQGDRQGYLATCLTRYLVCTGEGEEAILLRDLVKFKGSKSNSYNKQCENASLLWAGKLIKIYLASSNGSSGAGAENDDHLTEFLEACSGHKPNLQYRFPLPRYISDFVRKELGIPILPRAWEWAPTPRSRGRYELDPETKYESSEEHVPTGSRRALSRQPQQPMRSRRTAPPRPSWPEGPVSLQTRDWHNDMERKWEGYKGRPSSPKDPGRSRQTQERDVVVIRRREPRARTPSSEPDRKRVWVGERAEFGEPVHRSSIQKIPDPSIQTPRRQLSYDRVRGWLKTDGPEIEEMSDEKVRYPVTYEEDQMRNELEKMNERLAENMKEYLAENMEEHLTENMKEHLAEKTKEHLAEKMKEHLAELKAEENKKAIEKMKARVAEFEAEKKKKEETSQEAQEAPSNGLDTGHDTPGSNQEKREPTRSATNPIQNQSNSKSQDEQEQQSPNVGNNTPDTDKAPNDAIDNEQQTQAKEQNENDDHPGIFQSDVFDDGKHLQAEEEPDGNDHASIAPNDAVDADNHIQTEEDWNGYDSRYASKAPSDAPEDQTMQVKEGRNGVTKLRFSRDLLEENHMALVVWDKRGLQRTKTYIVDEGGVSEAKQVPPKQSAVDTGREPTIRIRTAGDRISTGLSGHSTSKRQSSMDKVKRVGSGEPGKLRDGKKSKGDKSDRWQDWWFPPTGKGPTAKPAGERADDPFSLYGARPLKDGTRTLKGGGSTERKKRDRWQDWWFPSDKRAAEPMGEETADPWSARGGGGLPPKDGAELDVSGPGDGGSRPMAEKSKLQVAGRKEPKGKEKEVVVDGPPVVAEDRQTEEAQKGPEPPEKVVVQEASKKVSGVASSSVEDSDGDGETGRKNTEGSRERTEGDGMTVEEVP